MISRKNIKVDEKGQYNGEYNFWSGAKRIDWNERLRIDESIINEALNISFKDNK